VSTAVTTAKEPARQSATGLLIIAIFKLVKAALLLMVGIGALRFLHRDLASAAEHWVEVMRADPDNRFIHAILSKTLSVTPKQLAELSVGTFFYAALLGTEGVGLLMRKHWAEYFTVISTALLLPLEIMEIVKHVTVAKIVVLLVNIAIVWYLIARLRREKKA